MVGGWVRILDCASPDVAAYAIERGVIVDAHAAARLGLIDRLRELLAANPALVRARGGDGQTPLHVATTVEILPFSPPLEVTDADFSAPPLRWAIHGSEHGWYAGSGESR